MNPNNRIRIWKLMGFHTFLFALLSLCNVTFAQNIVWANKVISATSETGKTTYSAEKILGKPDASPDSLGNAWRPNSQGKPEIIEVKFDPPFKAQQIFIVESLTPGFIKNVKIKNPDGIEFPVASYTSKSAVKGPRLLSINVSDYSVEVVSVTITLVPVRDIPVTIDAVGLTDVTTPFKLVNHTQIEPAN